MRRRGRALSDSKMPRVSFSMQLSWGRKPCNTWRLVIGMKQIFPKKSGAKSPSRRKWSCSSDVGVFGGWHVGFQVIQRVMALYDMPACSCVREGCRTIKCWWNASWTQAFLACEGKQLEQFKQVILAHFGTFKFDQHWKITATNCASAISEHDQEEAEDRGSDKSDAHFRDFKA